MRHFLYRVQLCFQNRLLSNTIEVCGEKMEIGLSLQHRGKNLKHDIVISDSTAKRTKETRGQANERLINKLLSGSTKNTLLLIFSQTKEGVTIST